MAGKHNVASATHPRRAVLTLLAVAAAGLAWLLVALTGAANSGGTYAAWRSSVTIQGAVLHTGAAGLQVNGFANLAHSFTSSSLSAGTPITVTNSGSATLHSFTTQVTLASGSSTALAAATTVSLWAVAKGTTSCTTPTSATSGTWAAFPTTWLSGLTLAPGASATYCALTTISGGTLTADPAVSVTPTVQVSGATAANGGGWTTGYVSGGTLSQTTPAPSWTTVSSPTSAGITSDGNSNITAVQQQVWPTQTCFNISVAYDNGYGYGYFGYNSDAWTVTISLFKAPFNASSPSSWNFAPQGYTTGTLSSTSRFFAVISGTGNASRNGFNATPTASSSTVNNTPVSGNNVAQLSFCVPTS